TGQDMEISVDTPIEDRISYYREKVRHYVEAQTVHEAVMLSFYSKLLSDLLQEEQQELPD
ncbi:MAG: hypothetical protein ABW079_11140, partial [Sedimenticola sp.]